MLTAKQRFGIVQTQREKSKHERLQWDKYRSWYLSEFFKSDSSLPTGAQAIPEEDVTFETNYPYAYVDTMIANICRRWQAWHDPKHRITTVGSAQRVRGTLDAHAKLLVRSL